MSATRVETLDISICSTDSKPSPARAEASRANGRLSCGPITPEGKERSRRNGCKDGLTGKGVVLPPAAGALAMSLSTVVVAFNALLLRRLDLRPGAPAGAGRGGRP